MSAAHTDRAFEDALQTLRSRLLLMAGRVEEMIARANRALTEGDTAIARSVVEADRAVNRDEVEIDEICFRTLARWQPMAGDLRLILMCMRMATDLERIADLAVNVAERAMELTAKGYSGPYVRIPKMAERCQDMLHEGIEALLNGDEARARAVIAADDVLDDLYHEVFKSLVARMSAGEVDVEKAIPILNVAKYLERIGDHTTNLAEQVVWLIQGDDIRHPGRK